MDLQTPGFLHPSAFNEHLQARRCQANIIINCVWLVSIKRSAIAFKPLTFTLGLPLSKRALEAFGAALRGDSTVLLIDAHKAF